MRYILFSVALFMSTVINAKPIANNAENVTPLLNGQTVPNLQVTQANGNITSLTDYLKGEKTVLFFYRGGWCPFCNTQLGQLKAIEPELKQLGFKLVGISTDAPNDLQKSIAKMALEYDLLSDFNSEISQAFGLAFFADEKTTNRYVSRLNLTNPLQQNTDGDARLVLPVPAVYVIDENARVQFNYVNPNFKVRLNEQVLLKVAQTL